MARSSAWLVRRRIATLASMLFLSACGIEALPVPTGDWKAVGSDRYMLIEEDEPTESLADAPSGSNSNEPLNDLLQPKTYSITLYTYQDSDPKQASTNKLENRIKLERHLPATVVDGILTINADGTGIPVLYHQVEELILVAGANEFRRVSNTLTDTNSVKTLEPLSQAGQLHPNKHNKHNKHNEEQAPDS